VIKNFECSSHCDWGSGWPSRLTPLPSTDADRAADFTHRVGLAFADTQFLITPGQGSVFYTGKVRLGAGLVHAEGRPSS
jgi:tRNA U34 2-thiouridine synthase MnmA/TrmU